MGPGGGFDVVDREDLIEAIVAFDGEPVIKADRTNRYISSKLIRCADFDGCPSVFVDGAEGYVRNAVVDAVHWARGFEAPPEQIRVYLPAGVKRKIVHALTTLAMAARLPRVELVQYVLAGKRFVKLSGVSDLPNFSPLPKVEGWADSLMSRPTVVPTLGRELATLVEKSVPAFRWYRNVTSDFWSGRVAGWQVCVLADGANVIRFGPTKNERVQNGPVSRAGLKKLAAWLEGFARERGRSEGREGEHKREHLLEAGIWREAVPVILPSSSAQLKSIVPFKEAPLQVPALYSSDEEAPARFVDAVMREEGIPWVGELKVESGGQGQYYRHAITQAVLYREFLRQGSEMHPWFTQRGLFPEQFAGAIAFPRVRGSKGHRTHILSQLRDTAACFGVEVVELPDCWEDLHKKCMQ